MSTIGIEQVVAAAPQRVWSAWTTPEGLAAWWWRHLPDTAYVVDARRGGQYRISSVQAGFSVRGTFQRVDEPRELVFSWVWRTGSEEEPEDRVTVGFADLGNDTTRVVVGHQMSSGGSGGDYRQGWSDVLARLGELVGAGR